jgi:response regulator RpfG family c-di-GMP phosphodiesterase
LSYVLIVDDEEDLLDIFEMMVSSQNQFTKIYKATNGLEALEILKDKGEPIFVLSDYNMPAYDGEFLYKELIKIYPNAKFVLCTAKPVDELKDRFLSAYGFIQKPNLIQPMKKILNELLSKPASPEKYIPIPAGYLKRLGLLTFNTYVKLGEAKYIKLYSSGDVLSSSDIEKIETQFFNKMHVTQEDFLTIVKEFEFYLDSRLHANNEKPDIAHVQDIIDVTLSLVKEMGWDEKSITLVNKTIETTLRYVSSKPSWGNIFSEPVLSHFLGRHSSQVAMLSCVMAQNIGWHSEQTHQKLILASFIHDHFVKESDYETIESLRANRDAEYLQHPFKAAELLRSLKDLPSDVDTIVLQHHERPDGSGFPRSLTASRISPLSALFIIAEEIVLYAHTLNSQKEFSFVNFVSINEKLFNKGPFQKILQALLNKGHYS